MKFSIVIPVYNAERYLKSTLESVLTQTYEDWECVCVDDGSKDMSGAIMDEYASRDSRFCVIHQENGGEGAARNAALSVAQGEWIVFLDSDDLLSPWALQTYARMSDENQNCDLMRMRVYEFFNNAEPNWNELDIKKTRGVEIISISDTVPFDLFASHFFQFAYKRTLLCGFEYTKHYVGADRIFQFQCLKRAHAACCAERYSYAYRKSPTSIMGSAASLRKLDSQYDHIRTIIGLQYSSPSKMLDAPSMRSLVANLLEWQSYDIQRNLPKQNRPEAWRRWFEMLTWLKEVDGLTLWQRFAVRACWELRLIPFQIIPRLLCVLPRALKLKGLHR